jgi:hypothetical protein
MRLGEPEMPSLLVSHHRPGFYFRVITEGHVHAGAEIVRIGRGRHQLSVADVDALLYLPDRDTDQLRQIVDEPALSPGWQQSFCDMVAAHENSVTATSPPVGVEPGWTGFRPLRVTATQRETANVLPIEFVSVDRTPLPTPLAGQYLTIRIPDAGDPAPLRSYSLSGDRFAGYLPPSTRVWSALASRSGRTNPTDPRERDRGSRSRAADSASIGHPTTAASSRSRKLATYRPDSHAEPAYATPASPEFSTG